MLIEKKHSAVLFIVLALTPIIFLFQNFVYTNGIYSRGDDALNNIDVHHQYGLVSQEAILAWRARDEIELFSQKTILENLIYARKLGVNTAACANFVFAFYGQLEWKVKVNGSVPDDYRETTIKLMPCAYYTTVSKSIVSDKILRQPALTIMEYTIINGAGQISVRSVATIIHLEAANNLYKQYGLEPAEGVIKFLEKIDEMNFVALNLKSAAGGTWSKIHFVAQTGFKDPQFPVVQGYNLSDCSPLGSASSSVIKLEAPKTGCLSSVSATDEVITLTKIFRPFHGANFWLTGSFVNQPMAYESLLKNGAALAK
jgi:hypothetical protein